jgi:hypothetical protein
VLTGGLHPLLFNCKDTKTPLEPLTRTWTPEALRLLPSERIHCQPVLAKLTSLHRTALDLPEVDGLNQFDYQARDVLTCDREWQITYR